MFENIQEKVSSVINNEELKENVRSAISGIGGAVAASTAASHISSFIGGLTYSKLAAAILILWNFALWAAITYGFMVLIDRFVTWGLTVLAEKSFNSFEEI